MAVKEKMVMKMKFLLFVFIIALFTSALPVFASDYVEGQLMVTIAYSGTKLSEMPQSAAEKIIAQKAAEVAKACGGTASCYNAICISQNKIVAVITSKTKTTAEMQAICNARKDVLSAKPNMIFKSVPPVRQKTAVKANGADATAGNGSTVDDPLFPDQWALCGANGLNAAAVWEKEKGSPDVVIAIADTGLDFSHEDIAENAAVLKKTARVTVDNAKVYRIQNTYVGKAYINEYNMVDIENVRPVEPGDNLPANSAYSMTTAGVPSGDLKKSYDDLKVVPDYYGHGSHIAGILAAVTNNGKGMAGLARNCKIVSFSDAAVYFASNNPEIYKDTPAYIGLDDAGLNEAWDEMVVQKKAGLNIRVANASYGGWGSLPPKPNDLAYEALKAVSDAGIIICVAAGNQAQNIENPIDNHREKCKGKYEYPVCYKVIDPKLNMIVVGATKSNGEYDLSYSNWGVNSVDIAAPGTQIYGTVPCYNYAKGKYDQTVGVYYVQAKKSDEQYSGTVYDRGTSYATPYVAASAALLCSHYPDKSAEEIIKLLYDNADDKFKGTYTTYGNLNIEKALNADPEPTPEPSSSGGGGGCNAGASVAMLLFCVVPMFFRRKK